MSESAIGNMAYLIQSDIGWELICKFGLAGSKFAAALRKECCKRWILPPGRTECCDCFDVVLPTGAMNCNGLEPRIERRLIHIEGIRGS